jgi:hypothetical protein
MVSVFVLLAQYPISFAGRWEMHYRKFSTALLVEGDILE